MFTYDDDPASIYHYASFVQSPVEYNVAPSKPDVYYCFYRTPCQTLAEVYGISSCDTIDFHIRCMKLGESRRYFEYGLLYALKVFKTALAYGIKIVIIEYRDDLIGVIPERLVGLEEVYNFASKLDRHIALYDVKSSTFMRTTARGIFTYRHVQQNIDYAALTNMYLFQVKMLGKMDVKTLF